MELRELGNRLFRLHARLIIVFLVAGVLGGAAIQFHSRPQYQASALFTMGVSDPQSAAVAAVLADTARGIATGPQLVTQAISEVGVNRSEKKVAAAISIQTQGASGVVMLSVTDRDPQVAISLANALADAVVATRAHLIQSGKASSLSALDQQEAATQLLIQQLTSQIGTLTSRSSASAIAQLTALEARLTSLQDLAGQINVQRNNLQAQLGPQAEVIDKAISAARIAGREVDNALLGGILGLVLGIAIAAAREVSRPSLVGAAAITRAMDAPLLGEMNTPPDSWTLAALPDAGSYIELAADARHVQETRFAALEPGGRHRARVRMLEGPLGRLRFNLSRTSKPLAVLANDGQFAELVPAVTADTSSLALLDGGGPPRTGLVVAVPRVLKAGDVDVLTNFIWVSGWTLLGVIVHSRPRKAIKTARSGASPAGSGRDSTVAQQEEVDAW
jgi:capsular polysaccharide biosynthesis protein